MLPFFITFAASPGLNQTNRAGESCPTYFTNLSSLLKYFANESTALSKKHKKESVRVDRFLLLMVRRQFFYSPHLSNSLLDSILSAVKTCSEYKWSRLLSSFRVATLLILIKDLRGWLSGKSRNLETLFTPIPTPGVAVCFSDPNLWLSVGWFSSHQRISYHQPRSC